MNRGRPPALRISSKTSPSAGRPRIRAGCDAYMSKPFNTRELPEVVSEMLTERQKKPA